MPEQSLDPGKAAADTLREKKGVDYGSAKLEQDSGEAVYVEYFRGKDLVRWIEANPGKLDHALKEAKSGTWRSNVGHPRAWQTRRGALTAPNASHAQQ